MGVSCQKTLHRRNCFEPYLGRFLFIHLEKKKVSEWRQIQAFQAGRRMLVKGCPGIVRGPESQGFALAPLALEGMGSGW
jgi:hypothetical protein